MKLHFILFFFFPAVLFAQSPKADGWFVFEPENSLEDGVIGMSDWLEKPAGQHGVLHFEGENFVFSDGTPIRFWGTNNSGGNCGPPAEDAEKRAQWYAKMGINAVRFHKFTYPWALGDENYSSRLSEEGWERFDYYSHVLKEAGIYTGWSPVFGHRLVEGDRDRVLAYDEITSLDRDTWNLINFAPDLQDVLIELMVHLLNHRNPHTGMRYAEDPSLVFVELQNEDNIFWVNPSKLEQAPTYKALFERLFSHWLRSRYGSHQAMVEAWGEQGLNLWPDYQTGEHLDSMNIYPMAWFPHFSPENIENSASPRRMWDTALFLYETQWNFYQRYIAAIRATGFEGPIVGSCWQAGYGVIHYYNLYTDYQTGFIDRHNYFGPRPHRMEQGPFPNAAMVDHAGSGLFSSGLQQVSQRPFVLSEWISKMPNEWIAEGPAIIATYGLGLQGWDGSYHFDGGDWGFSESLQNNNVYNTNHPTQIGQFPVLSRMIQRGDVSEGKALPLRKVHVPSLTHGTIGFKEQVKQQADVKELGGDMPVEALALGKLQLAFTENFEPTEIPAFPDLEDQVITSNTGELTWDYRDRGYFTVNTDGTQGICGFAEGKEIELKQMSLEVQSPFAIIYLTSLEKSGSIEAADRLLLSVVARARNSGMEYSFEDGEAILEEVGEAPVLMEAVRAEIALKKPGNATVYILDHDGRRTDRTLRVRNGKFRINGKKDRAVWYEIVFE